MARTRRHDRMRAGTVTALARIYNSKEWKAARRQAMHVAEFVCQHPGCNELLIGRGKCHVHHVKPLRAAMVLALEPLNHQALCPSHHSGETSREIAKARRQARAWLR